MKTIFPLTYHELPKRDQVGGKALALMQMAAAGMPVPPGLVLTVKFFEPWLDVVKTASAWDALTKGAEIGQVAKALQGLCDTLEFTENQNNELQSALTSFREQNQGHLYAVRSSSPEEDLEGASFAGGYETTLGVTVDAIEAATRHSFRSSFDERVFVYKKEHGFRLDESRIALVIQQQVDADAAGVAFSLNPLNNCYDEAVINANHGLGESVVTGEVEPDLFVVDRLRGEILETRIGSKQVVITLNQTGGTLKSTRTTQNETAITPAQVLELTRLLEKVEAYYQQPVDIEWALAGGKLFLLQARPITTYLPLPPEMITAPGQPKRLYANSTLIEQGLQEPLSVLGTDFLGYVLNKVGGPLAEGAIGLDGITFTAGGGYYMNISHARMLGMKNASLAPGSMGDPRVTEILDGIDMKQYTGGELPAKLKAMRSQMVFKMLPMAAGVFQAYFRPAHVLKKYQVALPEEIRRLETFSGNGRSLLAQAAELTDLLTFFYGDYGIPMILSAQLAQQRIQGLFKREAAQVQDDLINLGISLPGNKTTEMGELMYALAASPELKRFATAADFLLALEQGSAEVGPSPCGIDPDFVRRWKNFLLEFGFRCPGEIDPATPRPHETPARLFEQIKNMPVDDSGSFFDTARAKREAAYQSLYEIALKKGKNKAGALERYYKRWLTFGGYRETPKHYVIKVIDLFRRQALVIAQSFVVAGRLDTPEQIFDLTIADIDHAQADSRLDLRALGAERSAPIQKIRKSKLVVRIIDSHGKIYYPPHKAAAHGELNGVPISPGVVQGRVRVLHSASEKKLLPGEILVARATDPGWTPLFINARGIILEIGGALQHGAVVAREYGIPCVSGLDDATSMLKDGQLVEVDGSNGIVRILE
ncbi:MAG: PEP/pyruvate-binding domain-containing protein [Chloroflexota bacterium]